ncbi:hypothetical protein HPP92_016688 [Vanilla planifolia]|uniref:Uncharacterized protein n=1 Tax=Vanilla planifolia TaxID=51239 RepID=A0A835UQB8_VANPL|nr:hypothetical protein HPP92_016688 [Vanilla planifolia]
MALDPSFSEAALLEIVAAKIIQVAREDRSKNEVLALLEKMNGKVDSLSATLGMMKSWFYQRPIFKSIVPFTIGLACIDSADNGRLTRQAYSV